MSVTRRDARVAAEHVEDGHAAAAGADLDQMGPHSSSGDSTRMNRVTTKGDAIKLASRAP